MTGCTRANKSKLSLPSFALSLHKTGIIYQKKQKL